jgi:capsid portal protein
MQIDEILSERGSRYGDFAAHAEITQAIKRIMYEAGNWDSMSSDKKEALEMIAHKIGRIINGDSTYIDSWTDIGGYARLVEVNLKQQGQQ